jgi:energy-coupling factor transporter ATP-binding protein EcfA2
MDDNAPFKSEIRREPQPPSGSVAARTDSSSGVRSPLHTSGSVAARTDSSSGVRSPLHTSGSVVARTDSSSGVRSPLHTSGSVAARTDSSSGTRSPLHTSGSVAARTDSSSGVRSGNRRGSMQSGGSPAAKTSLENDPYAQSESWLGPLHVPESLAEVGVRQGILEDLTLKIIYASGPLSLRELVEQTKLPFSVVNELLRRIRAEQLCEVTGMTGNIPQIAMTSRGRTRAAELLMVNPYTGPAPVSLDNYKKQVHDQSVYHVDVHPPAVERAFAHLVLDADILEKIGTALNSGTSIFLYGPSGTGKTTIATALAQVLSVDHVWIPYAVEVDGQMICVYDPHVHVRINDPMAQSGDARWVLCQRPTVLVGGELTFEMLELQFNPVTKFYTAPVQMKANNGVLIIDDFGRQRLRPEELLNRWVVPLDRRIDFLSLVGGKKVEVPFEPCVVFATNLDPAALADEAFLRRIQTKIKVGAVSEQQFHAIFRAVCSTCNLHCETEIIDELINVIRRELKEPLRACHPRDLVNQICWKARYKQAQPCVDRDALMAAVDSYFVRDTKEPDQEHGV